MSAPKKTPYKYCIVPKCTNTTFRKPNMFFFCVPYPIEKRRIWCEAMKRDLISPKSKLYVCEDHFDVEKDALNLVKYNLIGGILRLKPEVCPHKFDCQQILKADRDGNTELNEKACGVELHEPLSGYEAPSDSCTPPFEMVDCGTLKQEPFDDPPEGSLQQELENDYVREDSTGILIGEKIIENSTKSVKSRHIQVNIKVQQRSKHTQTTFRKRNYNRRRQ